MSTYRVTYDDGRHRAVRDLQCPDRLPQPGDVYEAAHAFSTLADVAYNIGDRFEVLERTQMNKHHRTSSLGNLLIKCQHMTSVWTEFDAGVATGQFKLVEPKP